MTQDISGAAPEDETVLRLRQRIRRLRDRLQRDTRRADSIGFLKGVISTLRPGDLAVDCGANVGKITLMLAESGANVVAFEPDPWSFAQLEAATAHLDNVTRINAGVGVEDGSLTLYRSASFADDPLKQSINSSLMPDARSIDAEGEGIPVKVINFPAWLQQQLDQGEHIALVKMDIEGAELEIMETVLDQKLPERTGPFLVETHPGLFPKKRDRFRALAERARDYPANRVNLDWI
ncbi:FkbM family methyltransferase [Phaeobacter sp. HF9A]|uniref:FkbM family methyltransferase n=1 Tax=Phaeobacter sp. HF9A TaxID=2721561 RepID=UPI0014320197|nr:FkbM family methyltransferase [Phaeobacter sp. HF9A]NIZ14922.1 FkbM family methyltransferase [Phaeobacter sp. HF9A]